MDPIPDKHLRACLAVLYSVCIRARLLGYEGEIRGLSAERSRLLADMMDAVHNLPDLLTRWSERDETLLRGMLDTFDTKWASERIGLLTIYDDLVSSDT